MKLIGYEYLNCY